MALNRFSQVPVLDDDGTIVADSNGILAYLAIKYGAESWVPREPLAAARMQQWLSQSSGALARGAALARAINVFKLDRDPKASIDEAHWLLMRQEAALQDAPGRWIAGGDEPTIADVALYTYTAQGSRGRHLARRLPRGARVDRAGGGVAGVRADGEDGGGVAGGRSRIIRPSNPLTPPRPRETA